MPDPVEPAVPGRGAQKISNDAVLPGTWSSLLVPPAGSTAELPEASIKIPKQIDLKKFSYEELKKKYPGSDGYRVDYTKQRDSDWYAVCNETGPILDVTRLKDGRVNITIYKIDSEAFFSPHIVVNCDKNGKVISYIDTVSESCLREESTQVKNPYYTGDKYHVTWEDNIIQGENLKTGKKFKINTDELLELVERGNKGKLMGALLELSGEVLHDMSLEVTNVTHYDDVITDVVKGADGTYNYGLDRFGTTEDVSTVIHELGHAIQRCSNLDEALQRFAKTFYEELAIYVKRGGVVYKDDTSPRNVYCTANEMEMFAECYTLFMLGDCSSKDVILKHFPKTLKAAAQLLKEIRQLPDEDRHVDNRPQIEGRVEAIKEIVQLDPDKPEDLRRILELTQYLDKDYDFRILNKINDKTWENVILVMNVLNQESDYDKAIELASKLPLGQYDMTDDLKRERELFPEVQALLKKTVLTEEDHKRILEVYDSLDNLGHLRHVIAEKVEENYVKLGESIGKNEDYTEAIKLAPGLYLGEWRNEIIEGLDYAQEILPEIKELTQKENFTKEEGARGQQIMQKLHELGNICPILINLGDKLYKFERQQRLESLGLM